MKTQIPIANRKPWSGRLQHTYHNQDAVCLQAVDISPGLKQKFSHGYF